MDAPFETDVFLDVDGVLNAYSWTGQHYDDHWTSDPRSIYAQGFQITFYDDLITELNAFSALPNVHFYWLTTWLEKAPTDLAKKIGLDGQDWPVLGTFEFGHGHTLKGWWKYDAVLSHLKTSTASRSIWIDDELEYAVGSGDVDDAVLDEHHILDITPRPYKGITPLQIKAMEAWAGVDTPVRD